MRPTTRFEFTPSGIDGKFTAEIGFELLTLSRGMQKDGLAAMRDIE
jgi:hypothetical protein